MSRTDTPKGEGSTTGIAALAALVCASLPMNLDPAIHNIAVVSAGNDLRMTGAERALAASIGTLCIAAAILATGSLGDRLGRKKIMLAGLVVALAGGVVTATATTPLSFDLGRALSGIGFAASFGLSFALLRSIAPTPQALALSVARWLAFQTLGIVLLAVVGGYLAGVSWRAAYLLGPVVSFVALLLCLRAVPEAREEVSGPMDVVGLVLVAAGLVCTLYGVSNAASAGWSSVRVLAPLLAGLVLLVAFGAWEWRAASPAFPIRSFVDRELLVGALSGIGFNIADATIALQLSLLWQYVYRYSPFEASLGLLPFIVACILAAGWAGRLVAQGVSLRLLVVGGLAAMSASLAVMALAGPATHYAYFVAPLLVAGAGLMLIQTPTANIFVGKAPPALVGAMGSSRTAFGQFGFALGLAVSSSLLYGLFSPLLREGLERAGAPPAERAQAIGILQQYVRTGSAPGHDPQIVHDVIAKGTVAYMSAYSMSMVAIALLIAAIAVLCAWLLRRPTRAT